MQRATKIVATIGPATAERHQLKALIEAGVNVVRLNFSHGEAADHIKRAAWVREISHEIQREVAIMVDLQGPKIRVGRFEAGFVQLETGQSFILDSNCPLGNLERVGLDYPELYRDVQPGDTLLLNDGVIILTVKAIQESLIYTYVEVGGILSNHKGINRKGGGLSAKALTDKDKRDIEVAAQLDADFLALSFPRGPEDVIEARHLLRQAGGRGWIIAKIERAEAVEAAQAILEASDGIMVARGDLAVEVGNATVPAIQKRLIRLAREANRLVITATQMMESMISAPIPTRAEVSDVANAVLDGTDAVMLSAETASGRYPIETVKMMAQICEEAEKSDPIALDQDFINNTFHRADQSVAMAALFSAFHLQARAIVTLTESGSTALWMSRHESGVPIYALTPNPNTQRRLAMMRGVYAQHLTATEEPLELLAAAQARIQELNLVNSGDYVVITWGEPVRICGGTNSLRILKIT
ncbi:MAG: pyruvate kinase [Pseudomonadota bacterium]